ncbi:D-cysteine desulfhydrase family protein [Klebsiella sp. Ap-873]|nr:D-cysteine desulfhydrase family protein [Klebsiella sp. Ap-873]
MSKFTFPGKKKLIDSVTPIIRLNNFERSLDLVHDEIKIYVKRDDLTALGGGGNKTRKLEYHLHQAALTGATRIVTTGGLQSNHARLTAACCAHQNIPCTLILSNNVAIQDDEYQSNGNLLLDSLFGAEIIKALPGDNFGGLTESVISQYEQAGEKVYFIPLGGSTAVGCMGYVDAAIEIAEQEREMDTIFTHIYVANGSSGTQAGLIAGFTLLSHPVYIKGYSVLFDKVVTQQNTKRLVTETLALQASASSVFSVNIDDSQLGKGYGLITKDMRDALECLARTEGLLLDPVYSGKAFAGLMHDLKAKKIARGANVLFVMTGGTPGLFAYSRYLQN